MKTLLFLGLVLFSQVALAQKSVPNYSVQVGLDQNGKMQGWLLNFLPPPGHHFNTEAPMKVTAFDQKSVFLKVGATEEHVGFRLSDPKLVDGTDIDSAIFVCDDAKTYCIKKTLKFPLTVNSDLHALDFKTKLDAPKAPKVKKKASKKDPHGFWDNDLDSAVAEAYRLKEPLLIDFYGIWCPPCILFNETVYPKPAFKKATKHWVLLKMDADREESFELKSKFKIAGYPTTLALKAPDSKTADVAALSEIDRIVGYFPLNEFVNQLAHLYEQRKETLDEKLANSKQNYLRAIKQKLAPMILVDVSEKDLIDATGLAGDGELLAPEDHFFSVMRLLLKTDTNPNLLKAPTATELLNSVWTNRAKESPDTLVRFVELITNHVEQSSKDEFTWANDILDQLAASASPETLSVAGVELSIADIDSMRADLFEAKGDQDGVKKSYEHMVESYHKLMDLNHQKDSVSYNLELAFALWKSGKIDDAKAIYEKFIERYPTDFTFYFNAERMYIELKDFVNAKRMGERAFEYGYGDNKIRSLERLLRALMGNGDYAEALKRGSDFLATVDRPDPELHVRTRRYIASVEKAVNEAEAKVKK